MSYEQKYLKYKEKYISLKNAQNGGGITYQVEDQYKNYQKPLTNLDTIDIVFSDDNIPKEIMPFFNNSNLVRQGDINSVGFTSWNPTYDDVNVTINTFDYSKLYDTKDINGSLYLMSSKSKHMAQKINSYKIKQSDKFKYLSINEYMKFPEFKQFFNSPKGIKMKKWYDSK